MKRVLWVLLGGALAVTSFVSVNGCRTVPETGRKQLALVSADQELQLGLSAFDQMKQETPISKDARANALVARVGARIAAQASKDLPNAQWEFVVFDSPEANAFCLPGGKVGVYSGLLPVAQNEAGLAAVIGHEVAHAAAHHGAERMSRAMAAQGLGSVLGASITDPRWQQVTMIAYGLGANVGYELPQSRNNESEADHIGLLYMARAGYDPEEAIRFWDRFSATHKGQAGPPALLRTHPVDSKRIADLQRLMPEARAEYQRARSGGATPETLTGKGERTPGSTIISR